MMRNGGPVPNIAVFVDMENLIRSALEIALPLDLEPVIKKLLEIGRVSMRRGFGDLDAACRGDWKLRTQIRRMLVENLIQFEDIPYPTQHKNTADMRLTVEALSVAYTYGDVTVFAIVASDRDYVPLIAKLRELGREIIGVGCSPDTVNQLYVKSCDQFIYYSSLFPGGPEQSSPDGPPQVDATLLDLYLHLLCRSIKSLDQKGAKSLGTSIVPMIRQLKPDFDLALVGMKSFRDLIDEAERLGLCKAEPSGSDVQVKLTRKGFEAAESEASSQEISSGKEAPSLEQYRGYFESKLRCDIPVIDLRNKIYQTADDILTKRKGQPIALRELSREIALTIQQVGASQVAPTVFKVLYSLFRTKVFDVDLSFEAYNPSLKSAVIPRETWDDFFLRNCITVLKRDRANWPLNTTVLSKVFGVDVKRVSDVIKEFEQRSDQ